MRGGYSLDTLLRGIIGGDFEGRFSRGRLRPPAYAEGIDADFVGQVNDFIEQYRPALKTFGGNDLYPAIHDKAAAVLDSLIRNHPFIDGNKRTAITAAGLFLRRNGLILSAEQETLYVFTIRMATGEADFAEAREWLVQHTRSLSDCSGRSENSEV